MAIIPKRLMNEFCAHMHANDMPDMPEGAWFSMLEEAADRFMTENNLRGCRNDATHQYLNTRRES